MSDEEFEYSDEDLEDDIQDDNNEIDHKTLGSDSLSYNQSTRGQSLEIQLENLFYEADDLTRTNPNEAISLFEKVLQLDSNEYSEWNFRALVKLVLLNLTLQRTEIALVYFDRLLDFSNSPKAKTTEFNAGVQNVLDYGYNISAVPMEVFFEKALNRISSLTNQKLWTNVHLKLASIYLQNKDMRNLEKILNVLLSEQARKGDSETNSNGVMNTNTFGVDSTAIEISFLELNYYISKGFRKCVKRGYDKLISLSKNSAVQDPRMMGFVFEIGAKLEMEDGNYRAAYNHFLEAFKNYQESGNSQAKKVLKYVLLANMISLSDINPFDSQEAKALKDDDELKDMVELRAAFDDLDIVRFENILSKPTSKTIRDDDYMMKYINELLKNIQKKVLVTRILEPFEKVSFSFLSKSLNNCDVKIIQRLLLDMILEKQIEGQLDEVNQILILQRTDEKYLLRNPSAKQKLIQEEKKTIMSELANTFKDILLTIERKFEFHSRGFHGERLSTSDLTRSLLIPDELSGKSELKHHRSRNRSDRPLRTRLRGILANVSNDVAEPKSEHVQDVDHMSEPDLDPGYHDLDVNFASEHLEANDAGQFDHGEGTVDDGGLIESASALDLSVDRFLTTAVHDSEVILSSEEAEDEVHQRESQRQRLS